jgi:hypothetical protein
MKRLRPLSDEEWARKKQKTDVLWMPVVIDRKMALEMLFIQQIMQQRSYIELDSSFYEIWCPSGGENENEIMLAHAPDLGRYRAILSDNFVSTDSGERKMQACHSHFPVFLALSSGMIPNAGRNTEIWSKIDADTMKRTFSGTETALYRAFRNHSWFEKQLLFLVLSFLIG